MEVKQKVLSKNKITESKNAKLVFESAAYLAFGFILSTGKTVGSLQPFGVSLVAVSKSKNILFSVVGAFLGYLAGGVNESFARYLSALIIAFLGALAASVFEIGERPAFPMAIAFLADFASGFVMDFKSRSVYSQYIVTFGEALLCCAGAFFFFKSINSNYKRLRFHALPGDESFCIMASFAILMQGLSSLYIGIICPARALAFGACLSLLRLNDKKWGMLLSLSLGFAFSIEQNGELFIVGAFAFSFLISALFSSFSTLSAGIGFLCSLSFFCIASKSGIAFSLFAEGGIGVLIFLLMPTPLVRKLESLNKSAPQPDSSLRQSLVLKLRFASSAMAAISESVEQVRERINEIIRTENESNRLNLSEEEYVRREIILEKTNQIRTVASDQFYSISGMLEDLAFEFDEAETFDSEACEKIRRLLAEYDIFPKNISAIEDKYSRMRVEILLGNSQNELDNPVFQEEIGKICSRYFEKGRITNFKEESLLSFFERPNYRITLGFAQHSAEGKLCGDTVKIINDYQGHCIMIISDGMGRGSRAALDGAMGAGLISKLINAGFGFDSALKIVNCALLVKSNDESLATLDIASIDLFTGKCELFKAGAPASYIVKNKNVNKCALSSMPAGILRGVEFAKKSAVLKPGDSIALMSDGIADLGQAFIESVLLSNNDFTAQKKADYILSEAISKSQDKKMDDMSIIYAKLERN